MLSRSNRSRSGAESASPRLSWSEIQNLRDCRGRWVALRRCSFDAASGQATAGELVDRDFDLATLCNRLRDARFTDCSVLFCPPKH